MDYLYITISSLAVWASLSGLRACRECNDTVLLEYIIFIIGLVVGSLSFVSSLSIAFTKIF